MMRFALAGVAMVVAGAAGAAEHGKPVTRVIEGLTDCPDGGFTVPGSSTCIHLSGAVRVTTVLKTGAAPGSAPSSRTRLSLGHVTGRLAADVRMQTELGPVRAYTSVRIDDAFGPRR